MSLKVQNNHASSLQTNNALGSTPVNAQVEVSLPKDLEASPFANLAPEPSANQSEAAANFAQSSKAPSSGMNLFSLQIAEGSKPVEVTATQEASSVQQPQMQMTAKAEQISDPVEWERQQNAETVTRFYKAMQSGDYETIMSLYHPDAEFSDPAFPGIKGSKLEGMWKLITNAKPDIKFRDVEVQKDGSVTGHWDADYELIKGNPIHNSIDSKFEFKDGKIIKHTDSFNFSKWADQAFPGILGKAIGTKVGQFVMTRIILPFTI